MGSAAFRDAYRIACPEGNDDIDDASKTNIAALKRQARQVIDERTGDIDDIVKLLTPA